MNDCSKRKWRHTNNHIGFGDCAVKTISCLYCVKQKFPINGGSLEHAILFSLGGTKASRNIACQVCNTHLGNLMDREFAEQWDIIGAMVGVPARRGGGSRAAKGVGSFDNKRIDIIDGKPTISKAKVNFKDLADGVTKQVQIEAPTEAAAFNTLKQILQGNGVSIDDLAEIAATEIRSYGSRVDGKMSLGGESQFRAVAKMLLTYLATMISPQRLRSSAFRDVVNFIRDGRLDDPRHRGIVHFDFVTPIPELPAVSDLNHRAFIFASKKRKMVIGVLEIFGSFRYSAILSRNWLGPTLGRVYAVDPPTGRSVEKRISVCSAAFRHWHQRGPSIEASGRAMHHILSSVNKGHVDRHIDELLKEAFPQQDQDRVLSKDEAEAGLNVLLAGVQKFLLREESRTEFDLQQWMRKK